MTCDVIEQRSIIWLASYPKSGNTWLRAQLTALLHDGPVELDRLTGGSIAQDAHLFADATGLDPAELSLAELRHYRPIFHRHLSERRARPLFIKVHDRYSDGGTAGPSFPAAASMGAVYIVRNPLDVAVSFANHRRGSIDSTIRSMEDGQAILNWRPDDAGSFLPVELGDWSTHVAGWTRQSEIPLLLIRYEDMVADTAACLTKVARFAGLDPDPARIVNAVARAAFPVLQHAERKHGFPERPTGLTEFFRRGQAGGWKDVLTHEQVRRIVHDHRASMVAMGYDDGINS